MTGEKNDLGVDSTTIIEILLELEETFDVEFDVEDLEPGNLENVTSLSDYIFELKKM
ncbi:phosphopantetheine-binding protein [Bacillus halotolerans]|uniref:phosphopantetheine-binding protein n=1 Tax=Bacillus halotolerans TaxID=260554 RepID=UPI00374D576C